LGFAPNDSEEERLTKAVLTLSACLVGVLSFAWVFTYFAIGQPLSAAIPLAYQIVSLVSLVVFSSTNACERSAPASRMESHGLPGVIQVTERTFLRLCDRYMFEESGIVQVKGKGEMRTWLLVGRR
jgi:hypothetical protein